jgi:hypothetical protein
VIGYYIHHLGRGHLEMARSITARLSERVTGLSSLGRPADWPGAWVTLPRDDSDGPVADPTAHGQLHWAPLGHPGLRGRMAAIAGWIDEAAPSAIVTDVSAEVTLLARLLGVPVVSMVLPGKRDDPAHRLGHALAETLIAPWPASMTAVLLGAGPEAARVRAVSAFSRFDGRPPGPSDPGRPSVLVLNGRGGSAVTTDHVRGAAAATPGWAWTMLGGPDGPWLDDPWPALSQAGVVVTHAGLNALADVAAARKPAVVLPQARPHGEQRATGRALAQAGLAVVADHWPEPGRWPSLLDAALRLGGERWAAWSTGTGADDAAKIIESVAKSHRERSGRCAARS